MPDIQCSCFVDMLLPKQALLPEHSQDNTQLKVSGDTFAGNESGDVNYLHPQGSIVTRRLLGH